MIILQKFLQNVLRISLTTSAVIAILLLLRPLLHKYYTAEWRYFVWLVIAVRLLIPFSLSLPKTPVQIAPVSQNIEFQVPLKKSAVSSSPASQKTMQTDLKTTAEPSSTKPQTMTLYELLPLLWLTGGALYIIYHLMGYMLLKREIRRYASPIEDSSIVELWHEVKEEMNVNCSIGLFVCKKVQSPMMTGFLRPLLLLPDTDYADADLKIILRHELTHYKRKDIWYRMLMMCSNAVHWFNPFVYLMTAASNRDLESACDSEVVKNTDSTFRKQYSETILLAIQKGKQRQMMFSTYFYGGMETMKERFRNIFDRSKKHKGIIALCAVILIAGFTGSTMTYGININKEDKAINNVALLSSGNSCDILDGEVIVSYGTGASAVVPLAPDTSDQTAYFADKAVYISDQVTAVAYGNGTSPVTVLVSTDKGKTWNRYSVEGTSAKEYPKKYMGFTTQKEGWMLLAGSVTSGRQAYKIFETEDGGKTWKAVASSDNSQARVVTGAGFANQNIGFISFRCDKDGNPVMYRTENRGKSWTKCTLKIPNSFQSIATSATALSPVFNGAEGILPVTFRNQNWKGDPVDVTVQYTTSDYGKTWTFNEKYNLALIWADAWSTRDGRARYEIMNKKMQAAFRSQQDTSDNYVIRWSSPWVVSYDVKLKGEQAVVTYWYMDSTNSTYQGVEDLSFGTENGRTVVTGCQTKVDMKECVNTTDWKSVNTGLYTFSMPDYWNTKVLPTGKVSIRNVSEEIGTLSVLNYDASKPISQFEGNHAKILKKETLSGCKYPAELVEISRTQTAAEEKTEDNSSENEELHIYLLPKNSSYAYDFCFDPTWGDQRALAIAKSTVVCADRVQVQQIAYQWAKAVQDRNGTAQYRLMSQTLQKKVHDEYQKNNWVTGQSSPWVDSFQIKPDERTATVTYTDMTSEGFAGYYEQTLTFAKQNNKLVISNFTEPKQPGGQSKGLVLSYLENQKTYLTSDTLKNGMFSNMTLSIRGKTKQFSWKSCSEPEFLPKLNYADVNGDGKEELVVILCEEEGTGKLVQEIHVVNPENLSEIPVQDPLASLKKRTNSRIDDSGIKIFIDNQKAITFSTENVTNLIAKKASWFKALKLGSIVEYSMENNQIIAEVNAQLSSTANLGNYYLIYQYQNGQLKVDGISFTEGNYE